jgi:hypothetical protein
MEAFWPQREDVRQPRPRLVVHHSTACPLHVHSMSAPCPLHVHSTPCPFGPCPCLTLDACRLPPDAAASTHTRTLSPRVHLPPTLMPRPRLSCVGIPVSQPRSLPASLVLVLVLVLSLLLPVPLALPKRNAVDGMDYPIRKVHSRPPQLHPHPTTHRVHARQAPSKAHSAPRTQSPSLVVARCRL